MIDWLQEPRLSCETAAIEDAPGSGDNLTTTAMDGVSVKGHVIKIEANVAHVLVTQDTLVVREIINLNLDLVDGLQQPGLGCQHAGVQDTPGCGDDLATTTMDSVSVKCHIVQVKPDGTQVLIAQHSLEKNRLELWG